jgi:hypothetical protein
MEYSSTSSYGPSIGAVSKNTRKKVCQGRQHQKNLEYLII